MNAIIAEFARSYPEAFFIEVGAHDGVLFDRLRPHVLARRWSGIMVEPIPYLFERLRENYRGIPRLAFENVAIADQEGTRELYYIPPTGESDLPFWYDALGSFQKDTLIHASEWDVPHVEDRIEAIEVRCITFDQLCERNGVTRIDLVQIDTEGYDYEIIKLIDFRRLAPRLLIFEHKHLTPEDARDCVGLLRSHGYELVGDGEDGLCLRVGDLGRRGRRLLRLWRRVVPESAPA
jgi:FkbM family methyltransferase